MTQGSSSFRRVNKILKEEIAIKPIKIIDQPMGTSKTTGIIAYMNACPDRRFVYVAPFIKECDRIVKKTTSEFRTPPEDCRNKTDYLRKCIVENSNIAITHELFSFIDHDTMELLSMREYTLILDEVIEICEPANIGKRDTRQLILDGVIKVADNGRVRWIDDTYKESHRWLKAVIDNQRVIYFKEELLLVILEDEAFDYFSEVIVLTYLFAGSRLQGYFDIYQKERGYYQITNDGVILPGRYNDTQWRRTCWPLITLYKGKLNNIGNKRAALSASWFEKGKGGKQREDERKILSSNIETFFRYEAQSHVKENMYAIFTNDKREKLRYMTSHAGKKNVVACNCRAVNMYGDRTNLAYCVNLFSHPMVKGWFDKNGVKLDEDMFALAALLQWIWRSAIRNGKPIKLYVPSRRMRELLINFFEGDAA